MAQFAHRSDAKVVAALARPLPLTKLSLDRLVYLQRFLRWAPDPLIALVQAISRHPKSWTAVPRQDLKWLYAMVGSQMFIRRAGGLPEWAQLILNMSAGRWKAFVRRARDSHIADLRIQVEVNDSLFEFRNDAARAVISIRNDVEQEPSEYECNLCDKVCKSSRA